MTLKLIIVDDEYLIRQLIRNCIDWESLGIDIVGEMESAQEALGRIPDLCPDIIFTDICMPDTDGLTFSEQVKKKYPLVKIIAITGYDSFEYARRGIHIGIDGYVLKPINTEELTELVLRIRERIETERCRDKELRGLSVFKEETEKIVREYYLMMLLESDAQEKIFSSQLTDSFGLENSRFLWIGIWDYSVSDTGEISESEGKRKAAWLEHYCGKYLKKAVWVLDRLGRFVVLDPQEEVDYQEFTRSLSEDWEEAFGSVLHYGSDVIRNGEKSIHKAYEELVGMLQEDAMPADTSKLVYSMKQYIKENLDDPDLSLVMLARNYYMNSSYLSRIFKKEVKTSFIEYLIDQRIEKAKQLLRCSNMKSYEVGERVGIYNANYFGVVFKKKTGLTPVEYRKKYGE